MASSQTYLLKEELGCFNEVVILCSCFCTSFRACIAWCHKLQKLPNTRQEATSLPIKQCPGPHPLWIQPNEGRTFHGPQVRTLQAY